MAQSQGLSLIDTARMFVLLTFGTSRRPADVVHEQVHLWTVATGHGDPPRQGGSESCHRSAGSDVDATADHPAVSGVRRQRGMPVGCVGARAADRLWPDDIPFTVIYPRTMGLPTETRNYEGFWDLAQQEAEAAFSVASTTGSTMKPVRRTA